MSTKGDQTKPQQGIEKATRWNPVEPNSPPGNPKLVDPAPVRLAERPGTKKAP